MDAFLTHTGVGIPLRRSNVWLSDTSDAQGRTMRTDMVENVVDKGGSTLREAAWNLRLDKVRKKAAKSGLNP